MLIHCHLEEEQYNEQLKCETLARWQEAESGRVVTHQAMIKWLDTWGSRTEAERPSCGS